MCAALGVHLKRGIGSFLARPAQTPRHDFLQMLFPSFQRLYINALCMFTNEETLGCDEGKYNMLKIRVWQCSRP